MRTDSDLENMPPEERIKRLQEESIAQAEELEELLRRKERQLKVSRDELERSMQEILEEDEERFRERERKRLEEEVIDEPVGESLEEVLPQGLYSITSDSMYGTLLQLEKDIMERGYVTDTERFQVERLRETADSVQGAYASSMVAEADRSRGGYLRRSQSVLQRIEEQVKAAMGGGIDNGNVYR